MTTMTRRRVTKTRKRKTRIPNPLLQGVVTVGRLPRLRKLRKVRKRRRAKTRRGVRKEMTKKYPLENLFPSYCSRINGIWTWNWTQLGGSQKSSTVFGIHYLILSGIR
jgi:hypothetical protein